MLHRFHLLVLLLLVVSCGSTVQTPPKLQLPPPASVAAKEGHSAYRSGDYRRATERLEAALNESLSESARQEVLLLLAKSYYALGRTADATATLKRVDATQSLSAPHRRELRQLAYLLMQRAVGCAEAELKGPTPVYPLPPVTDMALYRRYLMVAANCRVALKRWRRALSTLEQVPAAFENQQPIVNEWVIQTLRVIAFTRVSATAAQALLKEKWVVYSRSFLALRLIGDRIRHGEHNAARELLPEIRTDHLPPQDRNRLQQLTETLKKPSRSEKPGASQKRRLVVLLPLSGPWSGLGRQLRDGILVAARVFADGPLTVSVEIKDTGGVAAQARRLYLAAARDKSVLAVIGPLGVKTSKGLPHLAEQFEMPTLAFAPRTAESGKRWISLFTEPNENVAQLVALVHRQITKPRCAVIRTTRRFDVRRSVTFRARLQAIGGTLVAEVVFDGKADFGRRIKAIRRAGVRCLYLPLRAQDASLVLRYLAGIDVWAGQPSKLGTRKPRGKSRHLLILGSETWADQRFLTDNQRYLQGVVIPAAYSQWAQPTARQFAAAFMKQAGHAPRLLNVLGAAAVALLDAALGKDGEMTRRGLVQRLNRLKRSVGLPVTLDRDPKGRLYVQPHLSAVSGTSLVSIP